MACPELIGAAPLGAPLARSCGDRAFGRLGRRAGVGRGVLPRPAARPLPRNDHTAHEQFAAPNAPRLPTLERAGQASTPDRAVDAQRLGELDVGGRLSEEKLRVGPTRELKFLGA